MRSDRTAANHCVSGLHAVGGDTDAFGDDSDAAGIDKEFVAFATFHHLGITGDNLHAGFVGRLPHGLHDALQVGKRQALFEYEPGSEVKRTGTAAGKVVHRPVHRQVADIPSGKENRVDHERVGRACHAPFLNGKYAAVVVLFQQRVAEGGIEDVTYQLMRHPPATAMRHQHTVGIVQRYRAVKIFVLHNHYYHI